MMFQSINIENFRGITKLKFDDFSKFNLFVGKNNSGKTSVLESLFLITAPTNSELNLRINAFRGYNLLDKRLWLLNFRGMKHDSTINLSAKLVDPEESRTLIVSPNKGSSLNVISKKDKLKNENELVFSSKSSYSEEQQITGIKNEFSIKKQGKEKFYDSILTLKLTPNGQEVDMNINKPYNEPLRGVLMTPNTNLDDIFIRFNDVQLDKNKNMVINILKQIEPKLEDIVIGNNGILYCDIGFDTYIPINILGDGILSLMSYILAIMDAKEGIICIDEIENGFHYKSLEIMWKGIFEIAKQFKVQLFATSHSNENIKAYINAYSEVFGDKSDLIRLYRIEKENEVFKSVKYDSNILDASLIDKWEVR